jgi:hypothetical protein
MKSLKIITHQDTLWGIGLNGKEFIEKYARKHTLQVVVVNNQCACYEICEENRSKEYECNDSKSSNADDFYNLYHSGLTVKDRRKKLQS